MAARRLDAEIDRLYQLAPDAFTAARNALAKAAGPDAAAVKRLVKPPIAAWAVNQVYWQRRDVYDALITAATELRRAHKAVLSGKGGDVRGPAKAHESAVEAALKAALSLLAANGQPATDATRQAIATTLRALPADEPPGRLTRTLQPGGFEMLAGLAITGQPHGRDARPASKPAVAPAPPPRTPAADPGTFHRKTTHDTPARVDPKAAARAREAAARAAREVREAEHTARREEFEAARAAREADKATRNLEQARETLAAAQREVEAAEEAATEAARARAAAEERASAAERTLEDARQRARKP